MTRSAATGFPAVNARDRMVHSSGYPATDPAGWQGVSG
jgi:hypothetical protein